MSMDTVTGRYEDEARPSVLITGASGFLGGYAVREFADHGYDVTATGRNREALTRLDGPAVRTLPLALSDMPALDCPVDTIVHAAALSSAWGKKRDFIEANVTGTENVIEFAEKNRVRRIVHVSSPSIYTSMRDRFAINEDGVDTGNTLNQYIRTKILAETALLEAYADGRIDELVIVRPRGLLGKGDPSMLPRLLRANDTTGIPLFNGGANIVDITCVENAALALRLAAEAPVANGQAYNITNGQAYNITNGEPRPFKTILDEFFDAAGIEAKYRPAKEPVFLGLARALEILYSLDPRGTEPPLTRYTVATLAYSQTLDITKARRDLGYEPRIGLSDGIRAYAESVAGERHG